MLYPACVWMCLCACPCVCVLHPFWLSVVMCISVCAAVCLCVCVCVREVTVRAWVVTAECCLIGWLGELFTLYLCAHWRGTDPLQTVASTPDSHHAHTHTHTIIPHALAGLVTMQTHSCSPTLAGPLPAQKYGVLNKLTDVGHDGGNWLNKLKILGQSIYIDFASCSYIYKPPVTRLFHSLVLSLSFFFWFQAPKQLFVSIQIQIHNECVSIFNYLCVHVKISQKCSKPWQQWYHMGEISRKTLIKCKCCCRRTWAQGAVW